MYSGGTRRRRSRLGSNAARYDFIHPADARRHCAPGPHCHLISEPIETITQQARPHYVALFRGHLNFSTVSLLSQTTFRYSMSNKSPEQLSPLFALKLTNVTGAFYISPDSGELANSLCLCIISYSLNPHNQILLFFFFCYLRLHLLFPLPGSCGALRRQMNSHNLHRQIHDLSKTSTFYLLPLFFFLV